MAVQFDPIAKDESLNTTEVTPRNVADVLAQELSGIATAIGGGSDKVPKTDIATVEPTNVASRAYSVGELVYVNGNLYKVITAISGGATFTVGTNIQSANVSDTVENIQNSVETLSRGKITNVYNLSLPCGAGYCAYLITLFTHGVGPDIIQLYASAGTVVVRSLITGAAPSGITSATYGADLVSLAFAGPSFFSCIGADPNGAI